MTGPKPYSVINAAADPVHNLLGRKISEENYKTKKKAKNKYKYPFWNNSSRQVGVLRKQVDVQVHIPCDLEVHRETR